MKFCKIAAAAALASVANASDIMSSQDFAETFETFYPIVEEAHPIVEESTIFPRDGWGVTDWVFGLLIGGYAPIQDRWRNGDCRAKWYNFGQNIIAYASYFDQPFDVDSVSTWA